MTSPQDIIAKVGTLPTLPEVATRINTEINNEALSVKLLAAIIMEDASLVARILRLSNSAFYGMPRQISSIEKAVMILGFDTVKSLALSVSIFAFFKTGISPSIDVLGLWNHSLGTAVSARVLMNRTNTKLAEQAFLSGIIHDIGKIVLINHCLSDMEKVASLIRDDGLGQEEAENQVFGFTHQRIGTLLLKEWKFPEVFIDGVKFHHDLPPEVKDGHPDTVHLVRVLCVANQLAKALALGLSINPKREAIPSVLWSHLGVDRQQLPELSAKIREDYQEILHSWHMD